MMKSVRSKLYDFWLSGSFGIGTPDLYREFLNKLPNGSKVLDIGVGTGMCIEKCADVILEKNLFIYGIDIDQEYIHTAQERIVRMELETNVTVELVDLLDFKPKKGYFDVVLFMESFPVIPLEDMETYIEYVKENIMGKHTSLVFINNLVDKKSTFRSVVKPLIKYVPFVQVDFGRLVDHHEFDSLMKRVELCSRKEVLMKSDLFDVKQYCIVCHK